MSCSITLCLMALRQSPTELGACYFSARLPGQQALLVFVSSPLPPALELQAHIAMPNLLKVGYCGGGFPAQIFTFTEQMLSYPVNHLPSPLLCVLIENV